MSDSINQLILNFLDRIIDENIRTAEAMVALKNAISEQRADINKVHSELANGLKSEIKDKILEEASREREILRELKDLIRAVEGRLETEKDRDARFEYYKKIEKQGANLTRKLDSFTGMVKSPKTWMIIAISLIVALSSLIGGIYKLSTIIGSKSGNTEFRSTENLTETLNTTP